MSRPIRVLILEDTPSDVELVLRELRGAGFAPEWECVQTEEGFLDSLQRDFDIILSDYSMPQFDGIRALALAQRRGLDIPFILVSGAMGEETAVAAMKQGATDYLLKDRLARLGPAVTQALEQSRLRKERARSEEALRESEERFRQLAENIHEVFWLTDPVKNVILYISPAYETIWGRSRAGVYASALSWLDSVHPEDKEAVGYAAVTKQAEGTYDEEYRIVRPDGSIRWIHDRAFPVRNGAGEIYRLVGVADDITERKLSDETIRASERRFSSFMDNVPGFAWMKNADSRYVYANKLSQRLFPSGREWRDRTVEEVWPPEIAAALRANDEKVVENEAPMQVVETVVQSGETRAILSSKFPILNGNGQVAFVCGIGIDITERRRAEQHVREQADIINLAHDAIVVRDLQGQIQFWNQGAERLYGWTATEVDERSVTEILYEELGPFYAASVGLEKKGKWSGELQHRCKDGANVMVDARWTLVRDDKGEPKSVLTISTDITEQRKIKEQFLRAQRLESVGTLASGVAHDLNNILAPILMGAAVLRRTEMPEADEMILSTIETCAQRGSDIVKQVLTFARGAEGARLLLQPAHLINDMAKIAEGTFPKTITVRTVFPQSLWPIEGDPTQLHQVLLNLSVNARDAMPAGGTLTLSAENFPVDEHYASMTPGAKAGPHVLFQVKDTGTGIPRGIIDKIFDPFFTTKELGHGTGLGLSTTIGIVKSHGGFVSVYSEIGRGTTFKVFLPAKVGELAGVEQPAATALPPANGELLLIVDDEKPILQVAQALLEGHGYQVLTAGDAAEALTIFAIRMEEIKLVLTDLAMPFMDGIALIRTLQKMKPDVKVIASTGLGGQEEHANDFAALNVRACLTKPYNKHTLLTTLHDALGPQTDKQ